MISLRPGQGLRFRSAGNRSAHALNTDLENLRYDTCPAGAATEQTTIFIPDISRVCDLCFSWLAFATVSALQLHNRPREFRNRR